jgi:predicted small secreted protein
MTKLMTALVLALMVLSGCGTVAGMGKDITNASEWTKEKMK